MSEYHIAGQKLAAMSYGCDAGDTALASGIVESISDPSHEGYGNLQRVLCKYAADAFAEAGEMASFEYELFKAAADADEWYPEMDKFSNAVLNSLGKVYADAKNDEAWFSREVVKNASFNLALPALATGTLQKTPDILKGIAGVGVGAGAGLGSLIWLMNRHASKDTNDIEALKAKVDYYNNLTDQIRQELGSEPATEENLEEAVHDVF